MGLELQRSLRNLNTRRLAEVVYDVHNSLPESPAGTGDADGLEPPKRPLKIAWAMLS